MNGITLHSTARLRAQECPRIRNTGSTYSAKTSPQTTSICTPMAQHRGFCHAGPGHAPRPCSRSRTAKHGQHAVSQVCLYGRKNGHFGVGERAERSDSRWSGQSSLRTRGKALPFIGLKAEWRTAAGAPAQNPSFAERHARRSRDDFASRGWRLGVILTRGRWDERACGVARPGRRGVEKISRSLEKGGNRMRQSFRRPHAALHRLGRRSCSGPSP